MSRCMLRTFSGSIRSCRGNLCFLSPLPPPIAPAVFLSTCWWLEALSLADELKELFINFSGDISIISFEGSEAFISVVRNISCLVELTGIVLSLSDNLEWNQKCCRDLLYVWTGLTCEQLLRLGSLRGEQLLNAHSILNLHAFVRPCDDSRRGSS